MIDIIRNYYEKMQISEIILSNKMKMFERNPDIKKEFEHWIIKNEYIENGCVIVEGYSAKKISEISKYMVGEGAFVMLIELREHPKNALLKIKNEFKMK